MASLESIRDALIRHQATRIAEGDWKRAAVAVILRDDGIRPEMFFIERAHREGDPWSGHMAFPGGRVEPLDRDTRDTAERETAEEVGLDLARAERLGRLDDVQGRRSGRAIDLVISAYVYVLHEPQPVMMNEEVASTFWVPVDHLLDPNFHVEYPYLSGSPPGSFPGIQVGEPNRHVVWGLTYRFLREFFHLLGHRLPEPV